MQFVYIFIILMILLAIKGVFDRRRAKEQMIVRLKNNWGKVPTEEYTETKYQSLQYYYRKRYRPEREGQFFLDDITWNDLNMEEVFLTMNATASSMGEEYLFALLHEPLCDLQMLSERERLITFFTEHPEERLKIQTALAEIGKHKQISIYEYMDRISDVRRESNMQHFAALAGMAVSLAVLAAGFLPAGVCFLVLLVYNIASYYRRKGEIEPYLTAFSYAIRLLGGAERLAGMQLADLDGYTQPMQEKIKKFRSFRRGAGVVAPENATGDMMSLFLDYVRILFHTDLIKFNSMLDVFFKNREELIEIFETIGFLDTMCAAASFRAFLAVYAVPELKVSGEAPEMRSGMLSGAPGGVRGGSTSASVPFLSAKGLYHLFVSEPVPADIQTSGSVLITGSNASGKSTFLKAVALNAILSQTIHTALCRQYEASCFRVLTSIALTDNLFGNESYYIVEIKSLKRILDAADKNSPMLVFVDEVLRGTNTVERIAASSRVLISLSEANALCFAATHDIELTHLLEPYYTNYHFEEQIKDGQVVFDYQLKSGRATSQNAIRLLSMMGYPPEVTKSAEETAKHFMETGEWKL